MDNIKVIHDEKKNKFFIELNGYKSKLKYKQKKERVLEVYKTEVPIEFRGHGIAKELAEAALKYASENGYKIKATCRFMQKFIEKNPQYSSLII
jgi:predicted GNAT family acetyltransferase